MIRRSFLKSCWAGIAGLLGLGKLAKGGIEAHSDKSDKPDLRRFKCHYCMISEMDSGKNDLDIVWVGVDDKNDWVQLDYKVPFDSFSSIKYKPK